jgi:DNA-binding XRE family transcriptional regulator
MKDLREAVRLTQAEMADLIGLGRAAYQDIETGEAKFKPRHLLALERVSLRLAVERNDINLALPSVRRDALDLAKIITGDLFRHREPADLSALTAFGQGQEVPDEHLGAFLSDGSLTYADGKLELTTRGKSAVNGSR